ncbi:MAG: hypothetical protein DMG22_19320 [Acidobacteria bacterium]|nr:MAG: hypothetical protein DMG22_19320 [Acidobacteriota bacterium]
MLKQGPRVTPIIFFFCAIPLVGMPAKKPAAKKDQSPPAKTSATEALKDRKVVGTKVTAGLGGGKLTKGKVCFTPTDVADKDLAEASAKCATVQNGAIQDVTEGETPKPFSLPAGENRDGYYRVQIKDSDGNRIGKPLPCVLITVASFDFDAFLEDPQGECASVTPYTRAVAGFSADAQSSGSVSNQYFIEVNVQYPLFVKDKGNRKDKSSPNDKSNPKDKSNPMDAPVWVWITPRISTLPSSTGIPLNSLGSVSSAVTGAGSAKTLSDVAQGFEALGGLEIAMTKPSAVRLLPGPSGKTNGSVSFIIAAGAITPISPLSTPQLVKLTPGVQTTYGIPSCIPGTGTTSGTGGCSSTQIPVTNVALVPAGRDRFFREGYIGFRLKTHYMDASGKNEISYPGTFDITWGFDEAVTRGHIRGGVVRVEGFYPFPFKVAKNALYVFGTFIMKPATAQNLATPLVLVPSDTTVTLASPGVFVQPVPRADRDYYRLGIGFDLVAAISAAKVK